MTPLLHNRREQILTWPILRASFIVHLMQSYGLLPGSALAPASFHWSHISHFAHGIQISPCIIGSSPSAPPSTSEVRNGRAIDVQFKMPGSLIHPGTMLGYPRRWPMRVTLRHYVWSLIQTMQAIQPFKLRDKFLLSPTPHSYQSWHNRAA